METDDPVAAAPRGVLLAEVALAIGGLAIGTGEFASMGLLPYVAQSLNTSIPAMGHMISAYALGVVFGAPAMVVLLARTPRRTMLIALMCLFALGNALSALAVNNEMMIAARFFAGLPHGAYFGVASLVAASLVPVNRRAQAVGRVMLGLSLANVVGVPAATALGQSLGWRVSFLVVAGLALLTAVSVRILTPQIAVADGAGARQELGAFRQPQVWVTLAVGGIGFGGLFAIYSYITPTLTTITGLAHERVPIMLSVIGCGMIVGSLLGGWLADRWPTGAIIGMLAWNAVVQACFLLAARNLWLATADLFLLGTGIAVVPALQTRLMNVAGDAQNLAAALNHSAFNIANALGAWLGGVVIAAGFGWASTGAAGALLSLAGLILFLVNLVAISSRLGRREPGYTS